MCTMPAPPTRTLYTVCQFRPFSVQPGQHIRKSDGLSFIREIISTLCRYKDVQIIDGAVCGDHIHLSVAIPPKLSISSFMGYLKGKSTLMIYDRHPELQSKWDKSFWARGYYVSTIGSITEDAIKRY